MDPVLRAALLSWEWRIEVIIPLLAVATLYISGWRRLRRRGARQAAPWRLVSYLAGLFFLALSLLSPLDLLSQQLFFVHMIQHLLQIMIAPPLLLLANPLPFMLWGLPTDALRRRVGGGLSALLHRESDFRRGLRAATSPGVIWLFWVIVVVGWHDPAAYNAALRSRFLHDLEHILFFAAGMLFSWHVVGAGPRIHKQFGLVGRIAFVLSAIPPNMALGVFLAFAGSTVYTYYDAVPRLWGISTVTDQRIGGVIMWVPGNMMYIIAALILVTRLMRQSDKRRARDATTWQSGEALATPGLER